MGVHCPIIFTAKLFRPGICTGLPAATAGKNGESESHDRATGGVEEIGERLGYAMRRAPRGMKKRKERFWLRLWRVPVWASMVTSSPRAPRVRSVATARLVYLGCENGHQVHSRGYCTRLKQLVHIVEYFTQLSTQRPR